MDGGGQTNSNDESVHSNAGPVIVFKPEYPKESPWKQPAVYVAVLALIVVLGGEWRRWVALDDSNQKQHDYYEEINVWETDTFNREKDVDAALKVQFGWDTEKAFGKLKPPPIPKER